MNWTALVPVIAFFVAVGAPAAAWSVEIDERERGADSQLKPTLLRYDEDYSYLRNPAKRTGAWWEPYKYIPLDINGTNYLTLGAELRYRQEEYRNFNWGEVAVNQYQWYRTL